MEAIRSPYRVARASLEGVALPQPFGALLGAIGPATSIFVWGGPGTGKTTLGMDLLGTIAHLTGPGHFVSAEERIGLTVQQKIERLQLGDSPVTIQGEFWGYDDLRTRVLEDGLRCVLLDTISTVDTPRAARATLAFLKWAKAHDVIFIFIAHAQKSRKTFSGPRELAFLSDVIIRCYLNKDDGHIAEVQKNPYEGITSDFWGQKPPAHQGLERWRFS